jgi:hypothetical protein
VSHFKMLRIRIPNFPCGNGSGPTYYRGTWYFKIHLHLQADPFDPDPDPIFHLDKDPDPIFHLDPDPAF